MPKIKPKRSTPRLDMTPMVDLAFLLVTFFMLTTKFRPVEPVAVDVPPSNANIPKPERHVLLITIAQDGRTFIDLDGKFQRQQWAQDLNKDFKLNLNDDEIAKFSNMGPFGVPMSQLKSFIDMSTSEQKAFAQPGVPLDSASMQLSNYVLYARQADPEVRIAIKGDRDADFKVIHQVLKIIQDKPNEINLFNLLTTMKVGI